MKHKDVDPGGSTKTSKPRSEEQNGLQKSQKPEMQCQKQVTQEIKI